MSAVKTLTIPGPLLSTIDTFLKGGNITRDQVLTAIRMASLPDAVMACTFCDDWLRPRLSKPAEYDVSSISMGAFILGKLFQRVPAVCFIDGTIVSSWGLQKPHCLLAPIYEAVNRRVMNVRRLMRPRILADACCPFFTCLKGEGKTVSWDHGCDPDPAYEGACVMHFKRLLVNHVGLDVLWQFTRRRDVKRPLTRAIIEMISEIENTTNAKQEELLFAYSSLFVYVHALTLSNDIDGPVLCSFLKSMPVMSPFLVLAIVNCVSQNMHIFDLIVPMGPVREGFHGYSIVDNAVNADLAPLVAQMPNILEAYFEKRSTDPCQAPMKQPGPMDDSEFLASLHGYATSLQNRMRTVLSVARERCLKPYHVGGMDILLLKYLAWSLQRKLADCVETHMFGPSFCRFISAVFNMLAPTCADQLGAKVFMPDMVTSPMADLAMRGVLCHLVPMALQKLSNDLLIPFCISGTYLPDATAHMLLSKLLQCGHPKLSPKVMDALMNVDDLMVVVEYIDSLTGRNDTRTCEETTLLSVARDQLISRAGIVERPGFPFLVIESIGSSLAFSKRYKVFCSALSHIVEHTAEKELRKLLKVKIDAFIIIRIVITMSFMSIYQCAELLCNTLCGLLTHSDRGEDSELRFDIHPCDWGLIVGQAAMARFVFYGFYDLALELHRVMDLRLQLDTVPLHWLAKFSRQYRGFIHGHSMKLLAGFSHTVSKVAPVTASEIVQDDIVTITNVLSSYHLKIIQDPEGVTEEYLSPYVYLRMYVLSLENVSSRTDEELAQLLTSPIKRHMRGLVDRDEACMCLANIAQHLSDDVGYCYFQAIMGCTPCEMTLNTGHVFLAGAGTYLLRRIASSAGELIGESDSRREHYLQLVAPVLCRYVGAPDSLAEMVCGLTATVGSNTPAFLQERIAEHIAFLATRVDFKEFKSVIRKAGANLLPNFADIVSMAV